jgi:Cu2+-exporting ATPase
VARVEALGYRVRPYLTHARREQLANERRTELRQLAVAGIGMMQVGMFAIALHAGDIQGIAAEYESLLRWVSLIVASFVIVYSARPFFESAWRHLRMGTLVMDLPVALAIGLAFAASVWATISQQGQVYFDSVVMFTFFLLLGRFLERRVRQRHLLSWIDAESGLPDTVPVRSDGSWQDRPRIALELGQRILIRPGLLVPVDARVLTGSGAVVEDTFNGEHLPRQVSPGDTVYAGTVNVEGALEAGVLGSYEDSRLAALQKSVETAQLEKPALARLADRAASWFVGGILLVTALTAAAWSQIDPDRALWVTLSVLVISCPCALALATPAALTSAASALRASGIITRGENALEALSRATHLVFDKTGTLTEGRLTIGRVVPLGDIGESEILALAAALQAYSSHPVARAFTTVTPARGLAPEGQQPGAGVEGRLDADRFRIGSEAYCREIAATLPSPPAAPFYWVALCGENRPLAWIGLDDHLRPEAPAVTETARRAGLHLELLTGDSSRQGPELAARLGIESVFTGMRPEEKMQRVRALQNAGGVVSMVGDGLNDAPVLAVADASFAVAGATDLARTEADFVIVGGDLHQVLYTWRKARQCRRIIRQNLCWALFYNVCAIPAAAAGMVAPWTAALGMSASSLLVVLNSLRLNRAPRD